MERLHTLRTKGTTTGRTTGSVEQHSATFMDTKQKKVMELREATELSRSDTVTSTSLQ